MAKIQLAPHSEFKSFVYIDDVEHVILHKGLTYDQVKLAGFKSLVKCESEYGDYFKVVIRSKEDWS